MFFLNPRTDYLIISSSITDVQRTIHVHKVYKEPEKQIANLNPPYIFLDN